MTSSTWLSRLAWTTRLVVGSFLAFLGLASLGLTVAAPEARAGRASAGSGDGRYAAYPRERNRVRMVVSRRSDSDTRIEVRDSGVRAIDVDGRRDGYGCERADDRQLARCVGRGAQFRYGASLGDGEDVLELSPDRASGGSDADAPECRVDLGRGQDRLRLFDVRGLCSPLAVEARDGETDTIDCGGAPLGEDSPEGRRGSVLVRQDSQDRLVNCPRRSSVPAPRPPGTSTQVEIVAQPNPVVFGQTTNVTGEISPRQAGVPVALFENTFPFTQGFVPIPGRVKQTDSQGRYAFFGLRRATNTVFQAQAQTGSPGSSAVFFGVRFGVSIEASTTTPRPGQLVRFSGLVSPANDGKLIYLRRKLGGGPYQTITSTTLRDAGPRFPNSSSYSFSLPVSTDARYVTITLANGANQNGWPASVVIDAR